MMSVVFMVTWLPDIHNFFGPDATVIVSVAMGLGHPQESPDEELRKRRGEEWVLRVPREAKVNDDD